MVLRDRHMWNHGDKKCQVMVSRNAVMVSRNAESWWWEILSLSVVMVSWNAESQYRVKKCWLTISGYADSWWYEVLSCGVEKRNVDAQWHEMPVHGDMKCWVMVSWNVESWCHVIWVMVTRNADSWCCEVLSHGVEEWNACSWWHEMLSHHHRNGISWGMNAESWVQERSVMGTIMLSGQTSLVMVQRGSIFGFGLYCCYSTLSL